MALKSPIRLSDGSYTDLSNFTEADVDLDSINTSLNYQYRFNGHHKDHEPLTVAQHTLLTMRLARILYHEPVVEFACLLHDMPEAYYGDITTNVKKLLGDAYRPFANHIDFIVEKVLWQFEEPNSDLVHSQMKQCDLHALDIERRVLWKDQTGKENWPGVKTEYFTLEEKRALFKETYSYGKVDLVDHYYGFVAKKAA